MSRVALLYITTVRFPFIHLQIEHIYCILSDTRRSGGSVLISRLLGGSIRQKSTAQDVYLLTPIVPPSNSRSSVTLWYNMPTIKVKSRRLCRSSTMARRLFGRCGWMMIGTTERMVASGALLIGYRWTSYGRKEVSLHSHLNCRPETRILAAGPAPHRG
jgi:hypothetical protein